MSDAEPLWIPLVDEPIGSIVEQLQAEDPSISELVDSPRKLVAFRTFAYLKVGIATWQFIWLAATIFLFLSGAWFGYHWVFPEALKVLIGGFGRLERAEQDSTQQIFHFEPRGGVRHGRPRAQRELVEIVDCGKPAREEFAEDDALGEAVHKTEILPLR